MSITAACDSGQSDSSTGEDDDNVFAPSAGKVLNVNCGPIHRRLCGPACVIISTYDTACNSLYVSNETLRKTTACYSTNTAIHIGGLCVTFI